ncbi:hypothetical protein D9M68_743160 [compost metagenome]
MNISKTLWLLQVSLLLYPNLLPAYAASNASAPAAVEVQSSSKAAPEKSLSVQGSKVSSDHRKVIEAHVRHSNHQIRLLLRSASMANIDAVLHSIDVIRQGDEECVQHIERCRSSDASSNTAGVSNPLPAFDVDSQL